ncbi:MAG TPA: UBP-type zinc finger domain-containing protein [Actinomycetota bacterium]|nr:UBP-type zinc finger domain-containing protein [Actinomycetota bacterium]
MSDLCAHFDDVNVPNSATRYCADCVAMGSGWVHLRLCLRCGYVGCCDSSPNQHTKAHVAGADHQIVRSLEPGEAWSYCYADDLYVEDFPGLEPA